MSEMKPCPFCPCKISPVIRVVEFIPHNLYRVECQCCEAVGPLAETNEEAVATWNTRYQPTCETCKSWKSYPQSYPCGICQEPSVFAWGAEEFWPNKDFSCSHYEPRVEGNGDD